MNNITLVIMASIVLLNLQINKNIKMKKKHRFQKYFENSRFGHTFYCPFSKISKYFYF
jgi:hypothetical protein